MFNTNGSLIQKVCHCLDQGRSHIDWIRIAYFESTNLNLASATETVQILTCNGNITDMMKWHWGPLTSKM